MFFFLFNLALSVCISGALFALLFKSLRINWERKNKRPLSFLTPVFLTLVFLLVSLYLTIPRLLDTIPLISQNLNIDEIHVDAEDIGWNTLKNEDRRFSYNRWKFSVQPGRDYRIAYTPCSCFIFELAEIAETEKPDAEQ